MIDLLYREAQSDRPFIPAQVAYTLIDLLYHHRQHRVIYLVYHAAQSDISFIPSQDTQSDWPFQVANRVMDLLYQDMQHTVFTFYTITGRTQWWTFYTSICRIQWLTFFNTGTGSTHWLSFHGAVALFMRANHGICEVYTCKVYTDLRQGLCDLYWIFHMIHAKCVIRCIQV